MRASNPYVGLFLATLSGCLWFLACTPFDLSALAWVAALPMLLAVDRAPSWKMALFLGWWAGAVETGGGFYWLIDTVQRFTAFSWIVAALVLALFCAARAVIFLLFTAIVIWIRHRRRIPMGLLAPLAMVSGEFMVPQLFPCGQWITQAWHPLVIQLTELTGPIGITALLMLVNGALYDVLSRERAGRASAAAAGAILAAALVFGAVRMHQVDELVARAPRLAIGLVQPNFAYTVAEAVSPEEATRELTALQDQSARLEHAGAQLIVWSEGAYPVPLPRELTADFPSDSPAMIRRGFTVPVVIGVDTFNSDTGDAYNSAMLFDRDGRIAGRYDKVRLLAFGEYTPGLDWFPWLAELLPIGSSRFAAGAGPGILPVEDPAGRTWRLGPLICYEDLLPDIIHDAGKVHPDLLVNLTSDQWFGAGSEPWEHLALSVFSTIELRAALVRAVNSGVTAMIDPNGRLLEKTNAVDPYRHPMPSDGKLVWAPKMAGGHTLYVAWGDWFAYASLLGTLIIAVRAQRSRRDGRGRRGIAIAMSLLVALGLTACGGSPAPPADRTLNVYNWADYIAPDTVANFERETGIKVRYSIFETNEVLETKLLTGGANYDIVVPSDFAFERLMKAGVFRKLDKSALPNSVNLDPDIMRKLAVHDPGNQYGVPYLWFTTGLGYNVGKVRERLGSGEFDSWSLLFDPKNAAKLADCGILVVDSATDVLSSALIYLGRDPASRDPADLNAAADALMRIRPFLRSIDSLGMISDLANGNLCLMLGWSGDVTQARYRAREASSGIEIRYVVPREGGLIGTDMMGIPADAPHPQNAEKWLNYLMRGDVMAGITNAVKYPNGNRAATAYVREEIKNDPEIYPDAQVRAKLYALPMMTPEELRLVTRLWTRFRTGQ